MNKKAIIDNITKGSPNRLREKYFQKYHMETFESILHFTASIKNIPFKWRVWHWMNDINYIPKCYCGSEVSTNLNISEGYRKWCSKKCAANDPELREKARQTVIEKYGVTHYSKTEKYKQQVRETTLDRWGVDNYSKTDDYLQKSRQTYLNKWGVTNFTKTEEYINKSRQTAKQKWGVDSYTKTDECKQKIKKTLSERKGVYQIFQDEEFRKNNFKIANDISYEKYLSNGISQFKCDNGGQHSFEINTDNYWGRKMNNIKLCTVSNPISNSSSIKESELFDFISNIYDGRIIRGYRDELEIDIYLPEMNIGFEFNGLYWHSDTIKDKSYHINKTNYFKSKGIRIFHIWEDDYIFRKNIVESQIRNILKKNRHKIFARKCQIKIVETKEAKQFVDNNHIQGYSRSDVRIGLYYESTLVSLMTFDHYEGRKKMNQNEWNLNRFCSLVDHSVIGSASKLLQYFISEFKPLRIISYADKDWSIGDLYNRLGFSVIKDGEPDYKYLVLNKRIHKSRFRKSRLKYHNTESEFAHDNGLIRIWDCGKMKFEMNLI